MNRFRLPAAILLAAALCPAQVRSDQNYVDQVVESARKEFNVPGIAVAIVKDGNVVLAKGYGVRKQGEAAPVQLAIGQGSDAVRRRNPVTIISSAAKGTTRRR